MPKSFMTVCVQDVESLNGLVCVYVMHQRLFHYP